MILTIDKEPAEFFRKEPSLVMGRNASPTEEFRNVSLDYLLPYIQELNFNSNVL